MWKTAVSADVAAVTGNLRMALNRQQTTTYKPTVFKLDPPKPKSDP